MRLITVCPITAALAMIVLISKSEQKALSGKEDLEAAATGWSSGGGGCSTCGGGGWGSSGGCGGGGCGGGGGGWGHPPPRPRCGGGCGGGCGGSRTVDIKLKITKHKRDLQRSTSRLRRQDEFLSNYS